MNLYEINFNVQTLLEHGFNMDCVDIETGEILPEKADAMLAKLQIDEAEKLESITLFIKNLSSDISSIKNEEKTLEERRKSKEAKANWLKTYLSGYLQSTKRERFETAKCALSFRKSEALEIFNEQAAGEYAKEHKLLKFKEPEIDKAAIKTLIKNGSEVPGAIIAERQNLQIK